MDSLLPVILGFVLGFGIIFLFKLGRGKMAYCTKCGQKHWVSARKQNQVCKKCGAPLKIENKAPRQAARERNNKNRKGK